ncbi:MAG: hypothetical protein Q7S92_01480 [Candidatus Diapherotrites archaeon]|nr:hypothetical protein [Candidatus Diapherotrites archaeon]
MKKLKVKVIKIYLFDIAEEILLPKAEQILGPTKTDFGQIQIRRHTPKYMTYDVPPILLKQTKKMDIGNNPLGYDEKIKIFEFGVLSIMQYFDFEGTLKELNQFSIELENDLEQKKKVKQTANELLEKIIPATVHPGIHEKFIEEYMIFHIYQQEKSLTGKNFLEKNKKQIAQLLKFETQPLSKQAIYSSVNRTLSYYETDLVIVDFAASLIVDEAESSDSIDILEYAKVQLLELRFYDSLLDKKLESIYPELAHAGKPKNLEQALTDITKFKLWSVEIFEKVENALKPIGDLYLTKIYKFALEEFQMQKWEKSVEERMKYLDEIYGKLNDMRIAKQNTIYEILLVVLELIIVILILIEIIAFGK